MSLSIFGIGGHSKVVIDVAKLIGVSISSFFDDNPLSHNTEFCDVKVIGSILDFIEGNAIIAIGDNKSRKIIVERVSKASWQTIIHPSAIISKDVVIGEGSVIMAGAIIQTGTKIGKHSISSDACQSTLYSFVYKNF
jgi:NDP-sugar pyrophosphorylase family protein